MDGVGLSLTGLLSMLGRHGQRRVAIFLLLPLLLSACGKQTGLTSSPPQPVPAVPLALAEGKAFPMVTLKTLSGESVPLQSLQGKMLILNVWATWCPPCRREMPSLERLSKTLDPQRFAVLGLSTDGDELLATEFLSSNHISFGNYFDRNGKLVRQMGLDAYPETFLIAPDGTLVKRVLGQQDWSSPGMILALEEAYKRNQRLVSGVVQGSK